MLQKTRALQALKELGYTDKVRIEHKEIPKTFIGDVEYLLVFPRFLLKYGRLDKSIDISFMGKIDDKRLKFLDKVEREYKEYEMSFVESLNGRDKSKKDLDEEYFKHLGRSYFVACPDGDFIWTYRFFEAIICKAIPIVENVSPIYDGYNFYKVGDFLEYRYDWVETNLDKLKSEMML
jgi:hypothetical protein